jgi:hypothetical protein
VTRGASASRSQSVCIWMAEQAQTGALPPHHGAEPAPRALGPVMDPSPVVGRDWSPVSSNFQSPRLVLSNNRRPLSPIAAEAYSPAVFACTWYSASRLPEVRGRSGARPGRRRAFICQLRAAAALSGSPAFVAPRRVWGGTGSASSELRVTRNPSPSSEQLSSEQPSSE